MPAPLPPDEYERLIALARYQILDTLPEEAFDRVTSLVADILGTDLAVINFVDQHRQWGKSCVGVDSTEAPREHSFCAWTVLSDDVMVVPDAALDSRFSENPMVTGEPGIRLYAGAPLITPGGHRIGALCVTNREPRVLSAREQQVLQSLAAIVVDELELRLRNLELEREVDARGRLVAELRRSVQHAHVLAAVTDLLDCAADPRDAVRLAASHLAQATDVDWVGIVTVSGASVRTECAWHVPGLSAGLVERGASVGQHAQSMVRRALQENRNLFVESYATDPEASQVLVNEGVMTAAALPLGSLNGDQDVLVVCRAGEARLWRGSDRALLEAAAGGLRVALRQRAHLETAQADARHDALTGLPNRRALDEALGDLVARGSPFTVAVVDVDGLKAVNDREGHLRGDQLLRRFGSELRAQLPMTDEIYRFGGDEFVVLRAVHDEGGLTAQLDGALVVVTAALVRAGFGTSGASAGVAGHPGGSIDPMQLLSVADERMYVQKAARYGSGSDRQLSA